MHEFLIYVISGLTTAGIYGITASGLTLTYTTTGIFNWSHGAIGMLAAFTYWQLRVSWHWPAPVAAALILVVMAPLVGVLLDASVMRHLRGASEAAKLVVTLALLAGMLGLGEWVWNQRSPRQVAPLYEGHAFSIGGIKITANEAIVLGIAAAIAIGLRILLHNTRLGVAMRATVDDPDLVLMNGANPRFVSSAAWAVGTSLAALAGILIAPTASLSVFPLTLIIVNAYAAAVIGKLRSLPMTFVGALILGLASDLSIGYLTQIQSGAQYIQGFIGVIPVVLLFIVLLVLPQARLRGHGLLRSREVVDKPSPTGLLIFVAVVVLAAVMAATTLSPPDLLSSNRMWGLAIVALSMIPLIGFAGRVSLCQLGIAGIGAVVVAHAGRGGNPLVLLGAMLAAAAVGALVALPALRLSGLYLALATAAFAVALDQWIFQLPPFTVFGHRFDLWQGGSLTVTRFKIGSASVAGPKAYFIFGAVMFCLAAVVVAALRRSLFGERLIAVKDSPAACATLGINPKSNTLWIFSISAAIAGLGGAIYAAGLQTAGESGNFDFFTGLVLLLTVVIFGINSVGATLAVGVFLGTPFLSNLLPGVVNQLQTVIVGLAALGVARHPNGILPGMRERLQGVMDQPYLACAAFGGLMLAWALRLAKVVSNWPWLGISAAVIAALVASALLRPSEPAATRSPRATTATEPPDRKGVTPTAVG
jgi:branched-chain amino acid transport system permease protein